MAFFLQDSLLNIKVKILLTQSYNLIRTLNVVDLSHER